MQTDAKRATDWLKQEIRFDERLSGSDNINDHEHLIAKLLDGTWEKEKFEPLVPDGTDLVGRIRLLATAVGDGPCTKIYTLEDPKKKGKFVAYADRDMESDLAGIMVGFGSSEQNALENLEIALIRYHQNILFIDEKALGGALLTVKHWKDQIRKRKNILGLV